MRERKLSFSGHETFVCRQFWLKKGFDFVAEQRSFTKEDSVGDLGVGKNMVTAIRFWLKGYNIIDKTTEQITQFGQYLLGERDPFLEDPGSLWLLHYAVVSNERVFIFNSFFNEFLKERNEFTKDQFVSFLKRKTEENELNLFSEKTYISDVNVFLRTYIQSKDGKADLEDETSNLLVDLNLISPFHKRDLENRHIEWYRAFREDRVELPLQILLFSILDSDDYQETISFYELLEGYNSPGVIFSLTEKGLEDKLKEAANSWPERYSYSQTAGNRVFQVKSKMNKWHILDEYYD